jgi:hypothetical protein
MLAKSVITALKYDLLKSVIPTIHMCIRHMVPVKWEALRGLTTL